MLQRTGHCGRRNQREMTMDTIIKDKELCPRCGGPLRKGPTDVGALSRADNETIVCARCGEDEALIQVTGLNN
jgi:hypothetical protein